jgi:hypothetical protein
LGLGLREGEGRSGSGKWSGPQRLIDLREMEYKIKNMDEQEFQRKYLNLKILKGIHTYLKSEGEEQSVVYPIRVPQELLYQMVKLQGAESADKLVHHIFTIGLSIWSERLFQESFGAPENLKAFIQLMKERESKEK